jgi:ABC-type branched-subunit amino acid transport system substrate-binding protein
VQQLGAKRVATFYQNDAYGTDGRDGVRQGVESAGGQMVAETPYEVSQTDFSSQIRKLQAARPDVVVVYALPTTAAAFLKQAKGRNWNGVEFMADNPMTDPIMQGLGGAALGGLTCNFFTAVNGDVNQQVKAKEEILQRYFPDVQGGYYSFQGMAGAIVAVEALKKIKGDVTPQSFIDALEQVSVDPEVTAPIAYGPNDHKGVSEFGFAVWKNGKIKVIESY